MSEKCVFCGADIPEGRQVCPMCKNSEDKRLSKFIDHFEAVATMGRLDGNPAIMYEEVAEYLKRFKYYEEAFKTADLCGRRGDNVWSTMPSMLNAHTTSEIPIHT